MVSFKKAKIAVCVCAAFALPAHADELSDLKTRMAEMLVQLEALQAKQKALEAKQEATDTKVAAPAPAPAPATGALPGSFLIPGTSTSLKVGGYAQLSVIREIQGYVGNTQTVLSPFSYAAGGIPWSGTPASRQSGETQLEARESRLNFTTSTPTQYGPLTTFIEGDFYGAGGSKLSTNGVALRLRHAMATLGPWMVGQYWSNSADLAQGPDVFDFGGPVGLAGLNRVPQIRYTYALNPKTNLSMSIEQPVQDFTGADGVSFSSGFNNISQNSVSKYPELTARATFADTWGRQSFGAAARKLTASSGGAAPLGDTSFSNTGWMVNYQGTIRFGKDSFYYDAVYEDGAGRYITQIPTSAVLVGNTSLTNVRAAGVNLAYQKYWAPNWRSTFDYGQNRIKNPHPNLPLTAMNRVESVFVNLIWTPVPQGQVGLEYTWARIKNEASQTGIGSRIMLVTRYAL